MIAHVVSPIAKGVGIGAAWLAVITIDEHSQTTIGSAVAVCALIAYLARWMQKVNDNQKEICRRLKTLEDRLYGSREGNGSEGDDS